MDRMRIKPIPTRLRLVGSSSEICDTGFFSFYSCRKKG